MYKKIITLFLLLDVSFFYLLPIGKLSKGIVGNYQKLAVVILIGISFILYFNSLFNKKRYLFNWEVKSLIILFIYEFFVSAFKYQQGIISLIITSNHYLVIIGYFLICYCIENENGIEKIEKRIMYIAVILSILFLIQYIFYNIKAEFFLYINTDRAVNSMRFGNIRIYENGYLPGFASVLAFGSLFSKRNSNKKIAMVTLGLCNLEIILISKNRMVLLMVILSYIYMIFTKYKKNIIKKIFVIMITLMGLYFIFRIPAVNEFVDSISLNDTSIIIRGGAISYYIEQLKNNLLLGTGFINPIENTEWYYMVRGGGGIFFKDDIGILGSIHTFGVIFIVWYGGVIVKMKKVLTNRKEYIRKGLYVEIYGICFFCIIGSIVMNPFDVQRIVLFPFILAMVDFLWKIEVDKNKIM